MKRSRVLAQESDAEAIEAIRKFDQQFEHAFNQQDAEAFRQVWAEDAQNLSNNGPTVTGADAIVESYNFAPEKVGTFKFSTETTNAEVFGDLAYGQGTFSAVDAEGQLLTEGKWIVIYKRVDGEWKTYRQISNSNLPLPEAPASDNTMTGGGN